eukprot:1725785-Amphidinium_carterae.1
MSKRRLAAWLELGNHMAIGKIAVGTERLRGSYRYCVWMVLGASKSRCSARAEIGINKVALCEALSLSH